MKPTIPLLLEEIAESHANFPAQMSKDHDGVFHPTTYAELLPRVDAFAAGLSGLGVARGDHVGLISDNRQEWFIADLAILSLGAADVPRGNDTTADEVAYILGYAGCKVVCTEDRTQALKFLSVRGKLPDLEQIIVFARDQVDGSLTDAAGGVTIVQFAAIEAAGAATLEDDSSLIHRERQLGAADDVATVIFTSGTTGIPKGSC